jgi:hypothetical protein
MGRMDDGRDAACVNGAADSAGASELQFAANLPSGSGLTG